MGVGVVEIVGVGVAEIVGVGVVVTVEVVEMEGVGVPLGEGNSLMIKVPAGTPLTTTVKVQGREMATNETK